MMGDMKKVVRMQVRLARKREEVYRADARDISSHVEKWTRDKGAKTRLRAVVNALVVLADAIKEFGDYMASRVEEDV